MRDLFYKCGRGGALLRPYRTLFLSSPEIFPCYYFLRQYRIILSADTASEARQMLSQKRR